MLVTGEILWSRVAVELQYNQKKCHDVVCVCVYVWRITKVVTIVVQSNHR